MTQFRLTQISDTHLAKRLPKLTRNFEKLADYIESSRPDLVLNSGDVCFDGPSGPGDLDYARSLHEALPVPCRYLPGNHDIGDNPTKLGPPPAHPVNETARQAFITAFGADRWRFEAAGWCFIGLNSLVMNSGLASEAEQFDWLTRELASTHGKPVALFLHKPVFLNAVDDPELASTAIRYVPLPARRRLLELLAAVDLRLIASGHLHQSRDFTIGRHRHVWAPSTGFTIPERMQEPIGLKEVGLVEYRFRPDSFEVRHLKAAGQIDVDLDQLWAKEPTKAPGQEPRKAPKAPPPSQSAAAG
jgi:3',5'-cyclic AMP phosphodiesterase CpdA